MHLIRSVLLIGLGSLTSSVLLYETAFSTEIASPDLSAQLQAVEQMALTPAAEVPRTGQFYSAKMANAGLVFAPIMPGGMGLDAWSLGDNVWLVNDLETVTPLRNGMRMMAMDGGILPPGAGGGGGGTNTYTFNGVTFTTNQLWLENIAVTNQTDSLVIHLPWNFTNGVYDLYYTTNLVSPVAWAWVLRTEAGQTNLLVHNATDAQGFYRLGPPNDLAASSLGTNFWVVFSDFNGDDDKVFSLYISSPVGAAGTVTAPGLTANGPILVITNCGDAAVNGTYALTSLTAQEKTDLQASGLSLTDVGYLKGANWVVWQGTFWLLLAYDPAAHFCMILYDKPGINLNGNWEYDGDSATPLPASSCAQVPLINQAFTVAAGAVTNINIPVAAMLADYDVVMTNGIHVTASQPVAVYGVDYDSEASTAFTAYPTTLLGTNYCVMGRAVSVVGGDGFLYSELTVLATASNTTVTIAPSATAVLEGHINAYTVTNLQAGQTYQIRSRNDSDDDYTNDVTGTRIVSDRPVAVFAGANLAFVPIGIVAGNPLVQEQLPVDAWGRQALAVGFAGRTGGDSYRVLAAYANTVVWTNGAVAGTNQAGQFLDLIIDGPVTFKASQPIQVAHLANGYQFDNAIYGDPSEILLPPTGHYLMTNIVYTLTNDLPNQVTGDFVENYLNLIVVESAITNTLVDGLHIATTNFAAIGSSGYYGAQIPVTNGVHTVTSSQPVGVEVYGFGDADAYGYFGGVVK